jgi:ketosteroid isomerase-like protein
VSAELERAAEVLNDAVRDGDGDAAAVLLHDEFVLTSSLGTGLRVDRAAWLDNLGEISTDGLDSRDVRVEELGEVGVVVSRMDWRATWNDDDLSGPYLVTDVWLRGVDGGWRLRWRSWARLNAEFLLEELCA